MIHFGPLYFGVGVGVVRFHGRRREIGLGMWYLLRLLCPSLGFCRIWSLYMVFWGISITSDPRRMDALGTGVDWIGWDWDWD